MNLLEKIENFGAIDAENDTRLIEYFVKTPILRDLYDYKKSIVIGRKGTGKTAIYKYIGQDRINVTSKLLFKDYPWKIHDNYRNSIVSERESFVYSWEFLFYIEIFKKIIYLKDFFLTKEEIKNINKINKWINKNWGNITFSHNEILSPKKSKLLFSFAPAVYGFSLGSISRELEKSDNPGNTLSEFNKKFENIIIKLLDNFNNEIILLFDELDLAYSVNDENYKNRLIGLLLAAYSFYSKFNKKVKIYLFLRSDIFNLLDFQDKNKIKDNMVEFLDWDPDSLDSKLSLKQVVQTRIKKNINSSSNNFQQNWNNIFDINNIGRNQNKWNFISDRSFIRPRDFIKFMNLSLEQAKLRLKNSPDSIDKITNEDMHAIRKQYSQYLFEELKDEIGGKYNNFNNYLEILRDIHHLSFTYEDFEKSYINIKKRILIEENLNIILERLFEFSIIGFYKPGGGGFGGSEYCFQYSSELQPFNSRANKFKVHFGFKEYLELIE